MRGVTERLAGWGNFPAADCLAYRPSAFRGISPQGSGAMLWRGAGRAYGDMALNPSGVILTQRLDCVRAFDIEKGLLTLDPGVTLGHILRFIVPRGWFLPVLPGTAQATIGGAVACNVHGKNHLALGDLGEHVSSLELRLADGRLLECSPQSDADAFWATIGGMGMTGGIESVKLQLTRIASARMKLHYLRTASLEAMIEAFERAKSDYAVGWIDHFASAAELEKGLVEFASHVTENDGTLATYRPDASRFSVPFPFPEGILNRWSMALYNRRHFAKAREGEREVAFGHFFHPLDGIGQWNRLYGKRGFVQYQCLLPRHPDVASDLRELLEKIRRSGHFSYLAVIKRHRDGKGMMTFSKDGYSLALDFRRLPGLMELLDELDRFVLEKGGRVYLAKDARLSRPMFEAMYGAALAEWKPVLETLDPHRHWMSLMAERLAFKEYD